MDYTVSVAEVNKVAIDVGQIKRDLAVEFRLGFLHFLNDCRPVMFAVSFNKSLYLAVARGRLMETEGLYSCDTRKQHNNEDFTIPTCFKVKLKELIQRHQWSRAWMSEYPATCTEYSSFTRLSIDKRLKHFRLLFSSGRI